MYGISKSIGEFVALVDSDDFVSENYIKQLMFVQCNTNSDIVMPQMYVEFYNNKWKY